MERDLPLALILQLLGPEAFDVEVHIRSKIELVDRRFPYLVLLVGISSRAGARHTHIPEFPVHRIAP